MPAKRNRLWWLLWGVLSITLTVYLGWKMFGDRHDKRLFLPGQTSHGHYQIEMDCAACHTDAFNDRDAMQEACMNCHATELKLANDSHPKSKFTDPRNLDLIRILDARYCTTCHVEHRPEISNPMGLTMPGDVCFHCHNDISSERETHRNLDFETCADAGCHNFHDNRALYEDFLLKHADLSALSANPAIPGRNLLNYLQKTSTSTGHAYPADEYPLEKLTVEDMEAAEKNLSSQIVAEWLASAHAAAGVNCSACHGDVARWTDSVDHTVCAQCHGDETKGFLAGRHGMRLARGLPAMSPAVARLPMRAEAHEKELTCMSCHADHGFDTTYAAVDACLTCHNDKHSIAFKQSKHYALWRSGVDGAEVSCATCHLPRLEHAAEPGRIMVEHNQNDNLRPNEKMLRTVCLHCHGLEFSIDALADRNLIENNFSGRPAVHVRSIEMARENLLRDLERRK